MPAPRGPGILPGASTNPSYSRFHTRRSAGSGAKEKNEPQINADGH